MKEYILTFAITVLCVISSFAQETYFISNPTITPNGNNIVFSYDGDLWKVPSAGGSAVRLTSMDGEETLPAISPDGKWVAFSATQYGNKDIYLMPLAGGQIKQLTFHDAADDVDSWSWDAKTIYFTSSRYNRFSGYEISIDGGTPKRLFENYFNNVHNLAVHPNGEIFFNESWESKIFAHRKRYKGDYNPDIKSYQPKNKTYKEYTNYRGKDFWPTIDKNGQVYFVSDESNGEYNLYSFINGTKTALTNFDSSIGRPQVSANGEKVVFSKDYQLFSYDIKSKESKKIIVNTINHNTLTKTSDFSIKDNVSYFDISPDNEKIAMVSRGELFVSDIKGKFIKQIKTNIKERIVEVKWLKDNKTLIYNQTVNGYLNLFSNTADGKGIEKQLTNKEKNNVSLEIASDYSKAAYISGRDELCLIDLSSFKSETIMKDEFWALYAPQPRFSPDNQYLTVNAIRDFEADVFVLHLASKKLINLTKTGVAESNPYWSADGKYIYYESNLTQPSYPYGLNNAKIYRLALDKYEKPFKSDQFDNLFSTEEANENPTISISINEDNVLERLDQVSPSFGSQAQSFVIQKDDASYIYYLSDHDEGTTNLWKTTIQPFERNKTEKVTDTGIRGYQIAKGGDNYYLLMNGNIHSLNLKSNQTKKITIDFTFRKNLRNEFQQMFYEAWAGFEENFYDESFHGEDWKKLRDKYAKYLPFLSKRSQLRRLFNEMLGELNTSHFGFNSNGKEENEFYSNRTQATGIIFSNDNPWEVAKIISDGPADVTGKNIQKGDQLIAVNGIPIDTDQNREMYFTNPSLDEELMLTFKRKSNQFDVGIHPISANAERTLLYDTWVDNNQEYVDSKSKNRIAYIHMKNMTGGQLENFKKEMVSETYKKDALILDLRNNTGGNVHDEVLQLLSQKPYMQWKYREGKLTSQPNFIPGAKPIVVLINEQTLSDGEVTTEGFKALGLGTVIGTETYRWIIFTSGKGLVDGSFYRLPSWGCYTLDGKNLEKEGVAPDIYIKETFDDRLNNRQPQLDKAIEEILKKL